MDILRNDEAYDKVKGSVDDSLAIEKQGEGTQLIEPGDADPVSKEIGIAPDGRIHNENHVKKEFHEMKKSEIKQAREEIADRVLISAVKTICSLQRTNDLNAYSRHPRIMQKFGSNYQIKITFAMHAGKAVEGAIGSEQKVDALYLSADAAICARVDELCKVYNRQILLTGELYSLLSERGRDFTRKIDQVTMNESKKSERVSFDF